MNISPPLCIAEDAAREGRGSYTNALVLRSLFTGSAEWRLKRLLMLKRKKSSEQCRSLIFQMTPINGEDWTAKWEPRLTPG